MRVLLRDSEELNLRTSAGAERDPAHLARAFEIELPGGEFPAFDHSIHMRARTMGVTVNHQLNARRTGRLGNGTLDDAREILGDASISRLIGDKEGGMLFNLSSSSPDRRFK